MCAVSHNTSYKRITRHQLKLEKQENWRDFLRANNPFANIQKTFIHLCANSYPRKRISRREKAGQELRNYSRELRQLKWFFVWECVFLSYAPINAFTGTIKSRSVQGISKLSRFSLTMNSLMRLIQLARFKYSWYIAYSWFIGIFKLQFFNVKETEIYCQIISVVWKKRFCWCI